MIKKINESQLRGIIRESVKKALNESMGDDVIRTLFGNNGPETKELFSKMDDAFHSKGINAYVSKFFSNEEQVLISFRAKDGEKIDKDAIKRIMKKFGYGDYRGGGIDWMNFYKDENDMENLFKNNEEANIKDMKPIKINESDLRKVVAENVKKHLAEMRDAFGNGDFEMGIKEENTFGLTRRDNRESEVMTDYNAALNLIMGRLSNMGYDVKNPYVKADIESFLKHNFEESGNVNIKQFTKSMAEYLKDHYSHFDGAVKTMNEGIFGNQLVDDKQAFNDLNKLATQYGYAGVTYKGGKLMLKYENGEVGDTRIALPKQVHSGMFGTGRNGWDTKSYQAMRQQFVQLLAKRKASWDAFEKERQQSDAEAAEYQRQKETSPEAIQKQREARWAKDAATERKWREQRRGYNPTGDVNDYRG